MRKALEQVVWGHHEIGYTLEHTARKTVAITVRPDGSVVVRAPLTAAPEAVNKVLRRRASWVLRQQEYFAQFRPRTTPREFIGGESHLYLGRRYRLRIRPAEETAPASVALKGGYLCVFTPETMSPPERVKSLLDAWYRERATVIFANRLHYCRKMPLFQELPEPPLSVGRLRLRWGSCSAAGAITLNVELVRAPRACIDYVIVHELCHLIHHNHSRAFFQVLSAALPDWEERKMRLEQLLS